MHHFLAIIVVIAGLSFGSANAASIRIDFSGEFDQCHDCNKSSIGELFGRSFSGSILFDNTSLDRELDPEVGVYENTTAPYGFSLSVNGHSAFHINDLVPLRILVLDNGGNLTNRDIVQITAISGDWAYDFTLSSPFPGDISTEFSGDQIPSLPILENSFRATFSIYDPSGLLIEGDLANTGTVGSMGYQSFGSLEYSVSQVPLPGAAFLLSSSLLALFGSFWRRSS